MLKKTFLFIGTTLLLAACGNKQSSEQSDGMAQFAKDSSFQAAHKTPEAMDFLPKGEMIQFDTPDGKKGSAYAVLPKSKTDKYLLVIHEWWGLNDYIKKESERLFGALDSSVAVLALDLYEGKVATSQEDAGKIMQALSQERGKAIVQGALNYIGKDAKIATIGWCFGGGWSLQSSIMAGDRGVACVMYYGMPVQTAKELAPLKAPILGIFGEKDAWINPEVIGKFEALAKATGKQLETHEYNAVHAFANPSNPDYNKEAASEANALSLAFLEEHLK